MFKRMSFKTQVLLGFGIMLIMMVGMALFSFIHNFKNEQNLIDIDSKILPVALIASDMATDVVQVQQFLTDISATHNRAAYTEAEAYAQAFKQGLAKLRRNRDANAEELNRLADLERDFDQFYADGKRMAETYLVSGVEAGNQIMAEFDKSSINLSSRMEALRAAEVERATAHVHELTRSSQSLVNLLVGLMFISVVAGFAIAYYLNHYLKKQLGVDPAFAKGIAKEIAKGNFNRDIRLEPGDTKSLLFALKNMQQQLREQREEEKDMQQQLRVRMELEAEAKESALRIQMALDKASANVMMTDESYNIIYLNEALIQLFHQAGQDLRKELAGFDADRLLGANIDLFYKDPSRQRAILDNLKTVLEFKLNIGNRYLDIIANPVVDGSGRRIGTVMEWQDRTNEVKIEQEIKTIVEAVKSGTLNNRLSTADKTGFLQILSININDLSTVIENVFNDIANVMRSMAAGNLSQRITNDYEGIYDSCKRSINSTLDELRERMEHEAKVKESALRIQMALDKTSTNVMVADENHNIIYINEALTAFLREAQNEIRRQLPQFDLSELIGSNIDFFHKNPAHQRSHLDNMRTTFKSSFLLGNRTISFTANPVLDENGRRVGTVAEWKDRTLEIKIEDEIKAIVDAVKNGELNQRLNLSGKTGFFQMLSTNINELAAVVESVINDIAKVIRGMAVGNLTQRITHDYDGVYGDCKNDINATLDKLQDVFSQIQEAAGSINQSSCEIASGNNDLSQRAEQQAASLEETASSMEELTSTVKHNADYAKQANREAVHARELAEMGSQVADSAIGAMLQINESNTRIGNIISVIDEIALQTNILSLNAAVEAARAGEQGRGFAVVASEVRNLAQRSAAAAKEIKTLITDTLEKVEGGGRLVSEAGKSLDAIVINVKHLNEIIAKIASESDDQFQGIKQINLAIAQMDDITQQNAALAEKTAASSVSMNGQAEQMRQLMAFFNLAQTLDGNALTGPAQIALPSQAKAKALPKQTFLPAKTRDGWEEF